LRKANAPRPNLSQEGEGNQKCNEDQSPRDVGHTSSTKGIVDRWMNNTPLPRDLADSNNFSMRISTSTVSEACSIVPLPRLRASPWYRRSRLAVTTSIRFHATWVDR
jgi:hypothetical protein